MKDNYTKEILSNLMKLKRKLEFEYSACMELGEDRERLVARLNKEYTEKLWRIL